ncbi:MAG: hypothetical protein DRI61_14635, partial [Chloroflexi bacterium]
MKGKRAFLFVFLIGLLVAGAFAGAKAYGDVPVRRVLTLEQAQQWAQAWVHRKQNAIPAWQGAEVGEPMVYFDLDGVPAVYAFPVRKGTEDVGHIIISYEAVENPVLAFGPGVAPHLRCPECVSEAKLAQRGLRLASKAMIYIDPLDYFYEVEPVDPAVRAENASANKRLLIPMGMETIITATHTPAAKQVVDIPAETIPDFGTISVASAATAVKIFGVPDYNQFKGSDYGYDYDCYSGCAPTSAANVMHFWDDAGFDGLAYDNWRDTTYYLRQYMETGCDEYGGGPTRSSKISPGMENYAKSRGFNFTSEQYCWPEEPEPGVHWEGCIGEAVWSLYTGQIDLHNPLVIALLNDYYRNHAVTGVGYDNDGGQYWIVHDNWPNTPEDIWVLSTSSDMEHFFYYTFIPPVHDSTPPTARITASSLHKLGSGIPVMWKGQDDMTGVIVYDVQYGYSPATSGTGASAQAISWTDWLTFTTAITGSFSASQTGTYYFRARAYDRAGNVSEWTSPVQTLVYSYDFTGNVLGNRGHWIPGAEISAGEQAVGTAYSGYNGSFTLRFSGAVTTSLSVTRTGYGALPPAKGVKVTGDRSGWLFVLPPADDLMTNGGFESGLYGWTASGPAGFAALADTGHTGDHAAYLHSDGSSTGELVQAVSAVVPADEPALSLVYAVSGTTSSSAWLWAIVEGSSDSAANSARLDSQGWHHLWVD